jgi:hypothetical protein
VLTQAGDTLITAMGDNSVGIQQKISSCGLLGAFHSKRNGTHFL